MQSEELLRRYAFVAPMRVVKKDLEFHSVRLAKGELAMMFLPSASIDQRVYPAPTTLDIRREKCRTWLSVQGLIIAWAPILRAWSSKLCTKRC